MPTGSIRVDPVGGSPTYVSGLGDIELSFAYDLGRLWGLTGKRPSVRVRPLISLPTGESARVTETSGEVPPNLISIGNGAIGAGLEIQASRYVSRSLALKAWLAARGPLTYSETDIRYGTNLGYGLGVSYRATKRVLLDAAFRGAHRSSSRSRVNGTLVNSGGSWWYADVGATLPVSDRLGLGVSATIPFLADVNGEQISQSWSARAFVAITFGLGGGDEHEDGAEHDHGDEHGEHGDDDHADGDGDHGDHGDHDSERGAVADLATGGASFALEDAAIDGKIVVIDFWADWCKPCKVIERDLDALTAVHDDLVVRRVEVPSFDAPVAREHLAGAQGLPIVWILDRRGRLTHKLEAVAPARVVLVLEALLAGGKRP